MIGVRPKRMREWVAVTVLPLVLSAVALTGCGREGVPAHVKRLQDEDPNLRVPAASALGRIDPASKDAVPALITALQDQDQNVRLLAGLALGTMGPVAKEAVPALIKLLQDQNT